MPQTEPLPYKSTPPEQLLLFAASVPAANTDQYHRIVWTQLTVAWRLNTNIQSNCSTLSFRPTGRIPIQSIAKCLAVCLTQCWRIQMLEIHRGSPSGRSVLLQNSSIWSIYLLNWNVRFSAMATNDFCSSTNYLHFAYDWRLRNISPEVSSHKACHLCAALISNWNTSVNIMEL